MVNNIMDAWERSAKRGSSQADGAVEDPAQDLGMGDTAQLINLMIDADRSNGYRQIGQRDELAQQTVVNAGRLLAKMTSAMVVDTLDA